MKYTAWRIYKSNVDDMTYRLQITLYGRGKAHYIATLFFPSSHAQAFRAWARKQVSVYHARFRKNTR